MKSNHPGIQINMFEGTVAQDDGAEDIINVEKSSVHRVAKNSPDVIFRVQLVPDYMINFISPSCFEMTGYTPEEFYADQDLFKRIVCPLDINKFNNIKDTLNDNVKPVILRWVRKDGSIIWTEQTRTVIHNEHGEAQSVYTLVRDITGRGNISEALQLSEETFYKVFQDNPNPICIISIEEETFLDINESYSRFTGYTREETIGHTAKELGLWVNEDDLNTMKSTLMQRGRLLNHQFDSRTKNGEIRTGLFSAELVTISGKIRMVLVVTDITEQKWAEDALKESEEFTSSLLTNTPNPIFVTYPDSAIKYVNPAFEKLSGYTLSDIIGTKTPYPWWPEETRDEIGVYIKGTHFTKDIKKEMAYRKKNGERFWVEVSATVINNGGERQYHLINWVDITERKHMEEALRFSAAAFKSIQESIIAVDNARCITYWNNFSEQLFGISAAEAFGKKLHDVIKPVDGNPELDRQRIKQLLSQGYARNERLYSLPHGDIWVDTTIQVMKEGDTKFGYVITSLDITARKKAEKDIRDSEEKFSRAFNSASDAMAIFSSHGGKFMEVNDNYMKLTGFSREELIGRNADELNMWASPEERARILDLSSNKGRFSNEEVKFRNKSGKISICLFSAESIQFGGERRMIVVLQDITERKRMEMALRESEEKFSKAFTTSANAICITSLKDRRCIEANESFMRFTGYSREEVIGHNAEEFNLWVYKEELQKSIELLKRDGRVINQEFSSRMKSGEIRVGLSSVEIINIGGTPCRMRVITDITERKKVDEKLKESEEFNSTLLTNTPNAILVTYPDGAIKYVNPAFEKLTGFSLADIIGTKTPYPWWPDDKKDEIGASVNNNTPGQGINLGKRLTKQMTFQKKNGELFTVALSATIINKDGKRQYILVTWIDITERKKAEEALKESEEKFSKAFSASANSICITNLSDNRLIEINESYSRFTGYTREEVLGRTATELNLWVNKEDLQLFHDKIEKEGGFHNLEIRSRMKSGQVKVGLASADIINISGHKCRIVVITDITERKKAEEALRDSEEKFSKAFLASPGAIAIATVKDGRFIDVNESFYHVMGYTRQEAIGRTSKELNIWVENESRENMVNLLNAESHLHNKMIKFRKKSGEVGIGLFSAEKIIINNEPCIISVNMEVTQQIKAEENSRLLGSVTQQVTDSIVVTDPDFKITYMNKTALDLFGYSIDEVMNRDIGLLDAAPVPRKIREEIINTLAVGKTWSAEFTKRSKDGKTFLCDCRRSPLFDDDGRLSSYIVVYRDITRKKEIEAKIKAQKLLVESILTAMPEGVLVIDSSDRIVLANESFRRIFHTGRKILENKSLNEVVRVGQFTDLYSSVKADKSGINTIEFRYKVKDSEKVIYGVITRMDNERTLLIFSDVSKEREEEDKLYLMDRLASLGEMAAGLAHELNNPLTGILTLSQLLVKSDLPEQHKEDIQCIYSEAKRAASIVKNVLLFTRNNSYENGESSVNEVVKEVLRLREHEDKLKNINVVTNLQDNLPPIHLDKYQLQQVFLNIILNAEAAIEEAKRPGTLTVTTERVSNHVNIMFSDTGCGIKKQHMSRIFDPFFTTKEIGKGTGLGLSICYGIIVKRNGKIGVKSQVGKGTTFTIRMPVAD